MPANIHVVPHGDAWAVKREGTDDPLSTHATQADAEDAGREVARAESVEFELHGRDGHIRERDSYGHDPRDVSG
jgi:hypothetical protein